MFIVVEVLLLLILGSAFHGFGRALTFTWSFLVLYLLPAAPLFFVLRERLIEQMVILNMTGIMLTITAYYVVGLLFTPITPMLRLLLPVLLALLVAVLVVFYDQTTKRSGHSKDEKTQ